MGGREEERWRLQVQQRELNERLARMDQEDALSSQQYHQQGVEPSQVVPPAQQLASQLPMMVVQQQIPHMVPSAQTTIQGFFDPSGTTQTIAQYQPQGSHLGNFQPQQFLVAPPIPPPGVPPAMLYQPTVPQMIQGQIHHQTLPSVCYATQGQVPNTYQMPAQPHPTVMEVCMESPTSASGYSRSETHMDTQSRSQSQVDENISLEKKDSVATLNKLVPRKGAKTLAGPSVQTRPQVQGAIANSNPNVKDGREFSRRVKKLNEAWKDKENYSPRCHRNDIEKVVEVVSSSNFPELPAPISRPTSMVREHFMVDPAGQNTTTPVGQPGLSPSVQQAIAFENWEVEPQTIRPNLYPFVEKTTQLTSTLDGDLPHFRGVEAVSSPVTLAGLPTKVSTELISQQLMNCGRNMADPEAIPTGYVTTHQGINDMVRDIKMNQTYCGMNPMAVATDNGDPSKKKPFLTLGVSTFKTTNYVTLKGAEYDNLMHEVPPTALNADIQEMEEKGLLPIFCKYRIPALAERIEVWNKMGYKIKRIGENNYTPLEIESDVGFLKFNFLSLHPLVIDKLGFIPFNLGATEFVRFFYISTVSGATWCLDIKEIYQDKLKTLKQGQANFPNQLRLSTRLKETTLPTRSSQGHESVVQPDYGEGEPRLPTCEFPESLRELLRDGCNVVWKGEEFKRPFIDTFGFIPEEREEHLTQVPLTRDPRFFPLFDVTASLKDQPLNKLNLYMSMQQVLPDYSVFSHAATLFSRGELPRPSLLLAKLMALIGRYPPSSVPLTINKVLELAADLREADTFKALFVEYTIALNKALSYLTDLNEHRLRPRKYMNDMVPKIQQEFEIQRKRCLAIERKLIELVIGEYNGIIQWESPVFKQLSEIKSQTMWDKNVAMRGMDPKFRGTKTIFAILDTIWDTYDSIDHELLNTYSSPYTGHARDRQQLGELKLCLMKVLEAEGIANLNMVLGKMKQALFRKCYENSLVMPVLIAIFSAKLVEPNPASPMHYLAQQCRNIVSTPTLWLNSANMIPGSLDTQQVDRLLHETILLIRDEMRAFMWHRSGQEQMAYAQGYSLFSEAWEIIITTASTVFSLFRTQMTAAQTAVAVMWTLQRLYDTWLPIGGRIEIVPQNVPQLDETRVPLPPMIPDKEKPEGMAVFTPNDGDYGFIRTLRPELSVIAKKFQKWREDIQATAKMRRISKHRVDDIYALNEGVRFNPRQTSSRKPYAAQGELIEHGRPLGTKFASCERGTKSSQDAPSERTTSSTSGGTQSRSSATAASAIDTRNLSKATSVVNILLTPKETEKPGKQPTPKVSDEKSVSSSSSSSSTGTTDEEEGTYLLQKMLRRSPEYLAYTRYYELPNGWTGTPSEFREKRKGLCDNLRQGKTTKTPKFSAEENLQWDSRRDFLLTPFRLEALLGGSDRDRYSIEQSYKGPEPYYKYIKFETTKKAKSHFFSGSLTVLAQENPVLFRCLESKVLNELAIEELCNQLLILQCYEDGHEIPLEPSVQCHRYFDIMYGQVPYAMFGMARKTAGMMALDKYEEKGQATWRKIEAEFGANFNDGFQYTELRYCPKKKSLTMITKNLKETRDDPYRHVSKTVLHKELRSFWKTPEGESPDVLPSVDAFWYDRLKNGYSLAVGEKEATPEEDRTPVAGENSTSGKTDSSEPSAQSTLTTESIQRQSNTEKME